MDCIVHGVTELNMTERLSPLGFSMYSIISSVRSNSFHSFPIWIPMAFCTELEQKMSWFIWKHKRPHTAKEISRKKNGAGGTNLPDFRLYYKATVIKTVWYLHKNRNVDQLNKTESPEMNWHTYGDLIFDKGGKIV